MPTFISHPAVALATMPLLNGIQKKPFVVMTGAVMTILPDIDYINYKFIGIPYGDIWSHRGFTHSIVFSLIVASLFTLVFKQQKRNTNLVVWLYFSICGISHGLLDAMTNGGKSIPLLFPFSNEGIFFGFRPIKVSTLTAEKFFGYQGFITVQNEMLYIWLPAAFLFLICLMIGKYVAAEPIQSRKSDADATMN